MSPQVFANYARYYDLLYRDKDYQSEANFVHELIQTYAPNASSILDLGCGTGLHAALLAEKGYSIHGVDRSPGMLEVAQNRLSSLTPEQAANLKFSQGDVQTFRVEQTFDVVTSLFHVVSYQTTNAALKATFETAKAHLNPGGLFLFDCWYGPAVLSDPPVVRVKRLEDDKIQVTRIAEPIMDFNQNTVDVNYQILIRDLSSGSIEETHEIHKMRYLFHPEVDLLLHECGLRMVSAGQWMTKREAGKDTWNVYFVGKF